MRTYWEIRPAGRLLGLLGWNVTMRQPGNPEVVVNWFQWKSDAVAWASNECRWYLNMDRERSELRIKGKLGRIMDSRTYGDDPKGDG